jgi:hypothetical protein
MEKDLEEMMKDFKNPFILFLPKLLSSQAFFNVSSCSFVLKQKSEKFKAK